MNRYFTALILILWCAPAQVSSQPNAAALSASNESPNEPETKASNPPAEKANPLPYGGDESLLLNYRLPRQTMELALSGGLSFATQEVPSHAEKTGGSNVGGFAALSTIFRYHYLFSLGLDISYMSMGSQKTDATISEDEVLKTRASLNTLNINLQLVYDLWMLRLKGGVGTSFMFNSFEVNGVSSSSMDLDLTYVLALSSTVYRERGLQVGIELRALINPAIEQGSVGLGATFSYDVWNWGK